MDHIKLTTETGSKAEMVGNFWGIEDTLNKIVDRINEDERKSKKYAKKGKKK